MSVLDENPTIQLGLRATQIIVFLLFGGVVVFLAVATWLVTSGKMQPTADPLISYVLPVAGVLAITMVAFLRGVILRQGEEAAKGKDASGSLAHRFQAWRTATILMAAAIEGAALMCAVAAIVDGLTWPIVVAGVFACLLLLYVPTEARLEAYLEA